MVLLQPIRELSIELTGNCNLHCLTCDHPINKQENNELSVNDIFNVINEFKQNGGRILYLTGGEPLLYRDLLKVIHYARQNRIHVNLVSNGTLINEKIVLALIDAGLNNITFSLDGLCDVNDFIRGKGVYQKVIRCLEIFQEIGSSRMVSVLFTVSRANYINLPDIIVLIRKYGVRRLFLNAFDPGFWKQEQISKKKLFWIPTEEMPILEEILERSILLAMSYNVQLPPSTYIKNIVRYFNGEKFVPKSGCYIPLNSTSITKTGQVMGCWKMSTDLSITEHLLKSIWASSDYQNIIKKAAKSRCPGCIFACYGG
jgi:MoaA/NifB/PqqE/SkfB family radical SAM enzyme